MIDYWIKREKEHGAMIGSLKTLLKNVDGITEQAVRKQVLYHVKEQVNCQGAIDRLGSK